VLVLFVINFHIDIVCETWLVLVCKRNRISYRIQRDLYSESTASSLVKVRTEDMFEQHLDIFLGYFVSFQLNFTIYNSGDLSNLFE